MHAVYVHSMQSLLPTRRPAWFLGTNLELTNAFFAFLSCQTQVVYPSDYIYNKHDSESSPIVMESLNLVFFTVAKAGDNVWKKLFRRMMGYADWKNNKHTRGGDPQKNNGLKVLADYNQSEATRFMTSPQFTRAIMVRDPKDRLVAAFQAGKQLRLPCCVGYRYCLHQVSRKLNFSGFFDELVKECDQPAWRPQGQKMEPKYYKYMNFVGRFENAAVDARLLLERIGAWEEYGKSGWGKNGNESIFFSSHRPTEYATFFSRALSPNLERRIEELYSSDYTRWNLTKTKFL
jgi:hypothetical protein